MLNYAIRHQDVWGSVSTAPSILNFDKSWRRREQKNGGGGARERRKMREGMKEIFSFTEERKQWT
jgi:hypothetical protein